MRVLFPPFVGVVLSVEAGLDFPASEKRKILTSAQTTPAHCQPLSRSSKISMAPTSVHIGRVACIGETTDSGRYFTLIYAKTHELSTMQDFTKISRCPRASTFGTKNRVLSIISGNSRESRSGIASNKADRHTLPVNTVSTSPCCKARFLLTS